jgi:hypothetical protein
MKIQIRADGAWLEKVKKKYIDYIDTKVEIFHESH